MSIYEPGNYDQHVDSRTSPWVWAILGIGALIFCCLMLSVVGIVGLVLSEAESEEFGFLNPTATPTMISNEDNAATSPTEPAQRFDLSELFGTPQPEPTPEMSEPSSPPDTSVWETVFWEQFDEEGNWGVGTAVDEEDPNIIEAEAYIRNGFLEFTVHPEQSLYWTTADEDWGDGLYEVEATAVDGPVDNGFGMLIMFDNDTSDFYMFEISSDGYAWAGIYNEGGTTITSLSDGWISTPAVNQGLNNTNILSVRAENGTLSFYVNDQFIIEVQDDNLGRGNIGLFVETFDTGGATVQFDNFRISIP